LAADADSLANPHITITRPCDPSESGCRGEAYASEYGEVELRQVAGKTRTMPPEFIDGHHNVSRAFINYCWPLVGELPGFERL
jgi:hypothetical protein